MLGEVLLASSDDFGPTEVVVNEEMISVKIHFHTTTATCPCCAQSPRRVHSRYRCTIADPPCAGRRVRLHLVIRHFFCDNVMCQRKTFAEGFPGLVPRYARRTSRLAASQCKPGLALGGEAGAKLLQQVRMPASGDTAPRLMRGEPRKTAPVPRVLGIDGWAWYKGQRYGTILIDLERHIPVDLLPDLSADSLAAWLQAHPGIEIISRDRSREYAKGVAHGAPDVVELADRWPLLQNLKDALIRILEQHNACLYDAASEPAAESLPQPVVASDAPVASADPPVLTKAAQRRQASRERRLARYQAVVDLHQQGVKIRSIAYQLGMGRATVRHHITAGGFPEMGMRKRGPAILDPYLSYLQERWSEGCHNGLQLFGEIQKQGYVGSRPSVSRWAWQMRKQEPNPGLQPSPAKSRSRVIRPWSPRYAVWLLLHGPDTLSAAKRGALERMMTASPVLRQAYECVQEFIQIIRQRQATPLEPWLTTVIENRIPGLSEFALGLERDKEAMLAALTLPWSNGQVEGHVNRLKLINVKCMAEHTSICFVFGCSPTQARSFHEKCGRASCAGSQLFRAIAFTQSAGEPVFS